MIALISSLPHNMPSALSLISLSPIASAVSWSVTSVIVAIGLTAVVLGVRVAIIARGAIALHSVAFLLPFRVVFGFEVTGTCDGYLFKKWVHPLGHVVHALKSELVEFSRHYEW
jgi:hypothetical protein